MIEKKYEIFLSSTFKDLESERELLINEINKRRCIPNAMELFPSPGCTQEEYIKEQLPKCDIYLLVVAAKYGTIMPNSKISYTEWEYDLAVENNIPIMYLFHKDIEEIPFKFHEKLAKNKKKLLTFRKKTLNLWMANGWMNDTGIVSSFGASFDEIIRKHSPSGWVRENEVKFHEDASSNKILELEKINFELKSELQKQKNFNANKIKDVLTVTATIKSCDLPRDYKFDVIFYNGEEDSDDLECIDTKQIIITANEIFELIGEGMKCSASYSELKEKIRICANRKVRSFFRSLEHEYQFEIRPTPENHIMMNFEQNNIYTQEIRNPNYSLVTLTDIGKTRYADAMKVIMND